MLASLPILRNATLDSLAKLLNGHAGRLAISIPTKNHHPSFAPVDDSPQKPNSISTSLRSPFIWSPSAPPFRYAMEPL